MTKKKTTTPETPSSGLNRHQRRASKRQLQRSAHRHPVPSDGVASTDGVVIKPAAESGSASRQVAASSSIPWWKDAKKIFHPEAFKAMKERIAQKHAKFDRPKKLNMERRRGVFRTLLVNKPGRERELLPDVRSQFCMLIPRSMARIFTSHVCQFVRIADAADGSWAIVPADVGWMASTEIAHVVRRSWWHLRYPYRIDMDRRVSPASLLYDYNVDPERQKQRLYVTREYVKVRRQDAYNDYLRIWLNRPSV